MKKLFILLLALSLTGCAARTMISQADFSVNSKPMTASTVTVRDRTGTELHHVMVHDQSDKLVSTATASGRGIVAGMTDGALRAAMQAAGMVGAAAVWPADNYTTNNSSGNNTSESASDSTSAGGAATATGGAATATAKQIQGQAQLQAQAQKQNQSVKNANYTSNQNCNSNVNNNKNKGGWTPPGQDKK